MRQKRAPFVLWAVLLGVGPLAAAENAVEAPPPARRLGGPLAFERNQGQSSDAVHFLARGRGYGLFLTGEGATLALRAPDGAADVIRLGLVGGRSRAEAIGESPMAGRVHYFVGNDPARWHRGIPLFARVRYREVYPGVDLVYYGKDRELEYDFELAPGADPALLRLRIDGAEAVERQEDGHLRIRTPHGEIVQLPPFAYQEADGGREEVSARFRVEGKDVTFELGAYDRSRALVIDPVSIVWSRFLGERNGDSVEALKADDRDGTTYVTGGTFSPGFPDTSAKLGLRGRAGRVRHKAEHERGHPLLGDPRRRQGRGGPRASTSTRSGFAYVTGRTASANFPVNVAPLAYRGGVSDAFVTKLRDLGGGDVDIDLSTYLGGEFTDIGHDIAVRGQDQPCVAGETDSDNFPQVGTGPPLVRGLLFDGFVTCFRNDISPIYSTYLGGKGEDRAFGIVLDGNDAHVVGETASSDFPLKSPLFPGPLGLFDAFVSQIDTATGTLAFSTYLGGAKDDHAADVALGMGSVFVTGKTSSDDFPRVEAFQGFAGVSDAFVTRIRLGGSTIQYSTFLGGTKDDGAAGITVGPMGYAYVTGFTQSPDFPTRNALTPPPPGAEGKTLQGAQDAFVTKIVPTGCSIDFSTYLGGELQDRGNDIGLHLFGDPPGLVVAGTTESTGFPVTMPPPYGVPPDDGFVVLMTESHTVDLRLTKDAPPTVLQGGMLTYDIVVTNAGNAPAYATVLTDNLPPGVVFQSATPGCTLSGVTVTCDLGCVEPGATIPIQIVVTVTALPPGTILTNTATVTTPPEAGPVDNFDDAVTTVVAAADLGISKVSIPTTAVVGTPILYEITVDNLGPSASSGVVVTDTLPFGVIFDSASAGCTHLAGVVTCNIGTINALASAVRNITVHADFPGLVTNSVSVTATTPDPVLANNSAIAPTLVVVPGETARFFTVRSKGESGAGSGENLLEWLNPPAGVGVHIHATLAVSADLCTYETVALNLPSFVVSLPFVPNQYDRFNHTGLAPGTTYCYTLFVEQTPRDLPRPLQPRPALRRHAQRSCRQRALGDLVRGVRHGVARQRPGDGPGRPERPRALRRRQGRRRLGGRAGRAQRPEVHPGRLHEEAVPGAARRVPVPGGPGPPRRLLDLARWEDLRAQRRDG